MLGKPIMDGRKTILADLTEKQMAFTTNMDLKELIAVIFTL